MGEQICTDRERPNNQWKNVLSTALGGFGQICEKEREREAEHTHAQRRRCLKSCYAVKKPGPRPLIVIPMDLYAQGFKYQLPKKHWFNRKTSFDSGIQFRNMPIIYHTPYITVTSSILESRSPCMDVWMDIYSTHIMDRCPSK